MSLSNKVNNVVEHFQAAATIQKSLKRVNAIAGSGHDRRHDQDNDDNQRHDARQPLSTEPSMKSGALDAVSSMGHHPETNIDTTQQQPQQQLPRSRTQPQDVHGHNAGNNNGRGTGLTAQMIEDGRMLVEEAKQYMKYKALEEAQASVAEQVKQELRLQMMNDLAQARDEMQRVQEMSDIALARQRDVLAREQADHALRQKVRVKAQYPISHIRSSCSPSQNRLVRGPLHALSSIVNSSHITGSHNLIPLLALINTTLHITPCNNRYYSNN